MKKLAFICALCCFFWGAAHAQFENVKRGDIIDINGTKAIVFSVNSEGHGSAMSIAALRGKKKAWCINKKTAKKVSTYSESDGMANTLAVYDFAKANGVDLSEFPAFEWCHSLGEGWYIPSVKQLEVFVNYILGNDQEFDWDSEEENVMENDNLSTKEINERILDAGGVPFVANSVSGMGIYTSTKDEDNDVFVYVMDSKKNEWSFKKVSPTSVGQYSMGRAFYDF